MFYGNLHEMGFYGNLHDRAWAVAGMYQGHCHFLRLEKIQ